MPFEITMPQLGLTMERGAVTEWLVKEGDSISAGQEVLTVETDKSVVVVEAHESGILARILVPAGVEVAVGTVLALVVAPDEVLSDSSLPALPTSNSSKAEPWSSQRTPPPRRNDVAKLNASWKARDMARKAGVDLGRLYGSGPRGQIVAADVIASAPGTDVPAAEPEIKVTPVAANLAEALGLDLAGVTGRGPAGRIGRRDVLDSVAALIQVSNRGDSVARQFSSARVATTTPLKGVRKIVSEGMATSTRSTARVTLFREVDAGNLVALRDQSRAAGRPVTYNDVLVRICAVALVEHPAVNARLGDGEIEHLDGVHIGLAVETDRGLIVPVLHQADQMSLVQIAAELSRLVSDARAGRSHPDDLSGGTFTISNLGMHGVEGFTPVINLPESSILGVGAIRRKPIVVDDQDTVAVRPTMILSLVFDHRVIDGAPAARFLDRIAGLIEEPLLLLTL